MKLFNTLTCRKEKLHLPTSGRYTLYFCGPTVYNYAHIGNFRTYLLQDVLVRLLEVAGYHPYVVRNITDVDDKTIAGAREAGKSLGDFTGKWISAFHDDCLALNIKPPDVEPRATDHIADQIAMIHRLIERGYAYVASDGSVYFKISAFDNYGQLSGLRTRELNTQTYNSAGDRNLTDEYERDQVADFALWKTRKPSDGNIFWSSPWGAGRPGWHIECSAMAKKYLGDTVDIHSGGVDLKFPHHENEIAQSECANRQPFVRHWMHIAHLLVDGVKMSKSLGNLYTLHDIVNKDFSAQCLRYALISGHYSQQMNFTFNNLIAAQKALEKLQKFFNAISYPAIGSWFQIDSWQFFSSAFSALLDDINTPASIGNIFKVINEFPVDRLNGDQKRQAFEEISTLMYCLGIMFSGDGDEREMVVEAIPLEVEQLAAARWAAKQEKNFTEADRIRQQLSAIGWRVEDASDGYRITHVKDKNNSIKKA